MTNNTTITVEVTIQVPVEKVWKLWTTPEHIINWNFASDTWHCPAAENNLHPGGKFSYRMEAKDGSFGFDFWGTYNDVKPNELIDYTLGDDRKATITFSGNNSETRIVETFEAENTNSIEQQKFGWQCILDNFKKYTETLK
jgi:uncharacterized protein YndB with AHSA1/START domain